jgi:hypothetical protein
VVNMVLWLLYPQGRTVVPTQLVAAWAPEPVWICQKISYSQDSNFSPSNP